MCCELYFADWPFVELLGRGRGKLFTCIRKKPVAVANDYWIENWGLSFQGVKVVGCCKGCRVCVLGFILLIDLSQSWGKEGGLFLLIFDKLIVKVGNYSWGSYFLNFGLSQSTHERGRKVEGYFIWRKWYQNGFIFLSEIKVSWYRELQNHSRNETGVAAFKVDALWFGC